MSRAIRWYLFIANVSACKHVVCLEGCATLGFCVCYALCALRSVVVVVCGVVTVCGVTAFGVGGSDATVLMGRYSEGTFLVGYF